MTPAEGFSHTADAGLRSSSRLSLPWVSSLRIEEGCEWLDNGGLDRRLIGIFLGLRTSMPDAQGSSALNRCCKEKLDFDRSKLWM